MKLTEYLEQSKYCRENNTPEGRGCDGCPAKDKEHCADALLNLVGKLRGSLGMPIFDSISKQIQRDYGLSPWNQLAIWNGELEFPK